MNRWCTIYSLLKDGIPWDVLHKMSDSEIEMLSVVSSEINKVRQDILAAG